MTISLIIIGSIAFAAYTVGHGRGYAKGKVDGLEHGFGEGVDVCRGFVEAQILACDESAMDMHHPLNLN